jgi:hypothetical protein
MQKLASIGIAAALFACGPSSTSGDDGDDDDDTSGIDSGPGQCTDPSCFNNCPAGQMTTITGRVTAPNGIDPVPGAAVYVPKGSITEFPPEVRCEVCSQLTDIAVVSTTTNTDGTFTLGPIPTAADPVAGFDVTVVSQMGRFRIAQTVQIASPCATNALGNENFKLPGRNEGDFHSIPKIAVASGDYDVMECVLLKIGIEQGQFDIYEGQSFVLTPDPIVVGNFDTLLNDLDKMKQYNIIFINCAGNTYENLLTNATVRNNIENYVLSGGRLYVTDWSYDYVEQVPNFSPLIDFEPGASDANPEAMNAAALGEGDIQVDATVLDPDMAEWLRAVEQVSGDEVINDSNQVRISHFLVSWVQQFIVPQADGVKVWLEGDADGQRPLTTTFDYAMCGRVLYSSYHTAGRDGLGLGGDTFPNYCASGGLTPQERVLEYLIFHIADCIEID